MGKNIPAEIVRGDTLGVVAPAGCINTCEFEKGLAVLKDMGFELYVPEAVFDRDGYLAGPDMGRAEILNDLFANQDVDAIICARGGYGSARILEFLDYDLIRSFPKRFVGFSDISALLSTLGQRCEMVTWHGPVVTTLNRCGGLTKRSLYSALTEPPVYKIVSEKGVSITPGVASGQIAGGNLATLCHMVGTPFAPCFNDAIVFFEDIGEPPYKIDRMLRQLKLSGALDHVAGVVLGSFDNCGDLEEIFSTVKGIFDGKIPILGGVDIGHGRENISIPVGLEAQMDAGKCEIEFI